MTICEERLRGDITVFSYVKGCCKEEGYKLLSLHVGQEVMGFIFSKGDLG